MMILSYVMESDFLEVIKGWCVIEWSLVGG